MDEERSESDVVAQSIADASSLRALIDGEARKEEYRTGLGALTGFQGIWKFAALHCPHR